MTKKELLFGEKLTKQGRRWELAKRFKLKKTTYTPDFYLPDEDLYIELSTDIRLYQHNEHKYKEFRRLYPQLNFIIVDMDFNLLPKRKRSIYSEKECVHCNYKWNPRKRKPRQCPSCKRYNWDKKREK
jgi:hypothetical protein